MLGVGALSSAASRPEMLVSTDWLVKHIADLNVVILHVAATRTAYDAGHIPGARFVALGSLAVTRDGIPNELPPVDDLRIVIEAAGVSDDSRVILYSDASVLPATRAYFTFDYLGHGGHVALLNGGLSAWKQEGRVLSTESPAPLQGRFTPQPKASVLATIDTVKQFSVGKGPDILLDVRSAADFRGEKGGHIPAAVNGYWMETQSSATDPALKPDTELLKFFAAIGITPDRRVVTYCNSGMQASQSYFTLKYLGYDVRMYDGSMSEWGAKGGPIEK